MGARRGRGGIGGWRLRLRRTVHHSTSQQPGEHDGDAGAGGDSPQAESAIGCTLGAVTAAGSSGQASLDHVLRQAAAARAEQPDATG